MGMGGGSSPGLAQSIFVGAVVCVVTASLTFAISRLGDRYTGTAAERDWGKHDQLHRDVNAAIRQSMVDHLADGPHDGVAVAITRLETVIEGLRQEVSALRFEVQQTDSDFQ